MDQLAPIDLNLASDILNKAVDSNAILQFKMTDEKKIINAKLLRPSNKKQYFLSEKNLALTENRDITIKIIIDNRLYFLKTVTKKNGESFYFDSFDNMYELVRRKKPRFKIPEQWSQSASLQMLEASSSDLKIPATVHEMSAAGMKLDLSSELSRFEKNQTIKIQFKIFRRAEVTVNAKIIHLTKKKSAGPTIGVSFVDTTKLIENKIQNICDDLAFFYTSEASVT